MTKNSIPYNRNLFIADNLPVLRRLDSNSIDLIATDPPFNKGPRVRVDDEGRRQRVVQGRTASTFAAW